MNELLTEQQAIDLLQETFPDLDIYDKRFWGRACARLLRKNEKLRTALEFYADEKHFADWEYNTRKSYPDGWTLYEDYSALVETGEVARKALEGK